METAAEKPTKIVSQQKFTRRRNTYGSETVSRWCQDRDNAQTRAAAGHGMADRFFLDLGATCTTQISSSVCHPIFLLFSFFTKLNQNWAYWVGPIWRWTPDVLRAVASRTERCSMAGARCQTHSAPRRARQGQALARSRRRSRVQRGAIVVAIFFWKWIDRGWLEDSMEQIGLGSCSRPKLFHVKLIAHIAADYREEEEDQRETKRDPNPKLLC
jgi:hypothetical protein